MEGDHLPDTFHAPGVDGGDRLDRPATLPELTWGITADELERRHMMHPTTDRPGVRRCEECRSRVTERPDGTEAGHTRGWREPPCSQQSGLSPPGE